MRRPEHCGYVNDYRDNSLNDVNSVNWFILLSPICNSHVEWFLLLTTIYSLFLQLIVSPFFLLSFTASCRSFCSFLYVSIKIVSSAYLLLLRLCQPVMNPGRISNSLRIASLYRLNKSGEKMHPCLMPLSIIVNLMNSFFICKQVVCFQYMLGLMLIQQF